MTISGFSYVRNGIQYQYPFLASIQSILPICDEFVIAIGDSQDGTRDAVLALNNPKIRIIDTVWDDEMRVGGKIFAQQTNLALAACTGDWLFHIQADEVIHENDLPVVKSLIEQADTNPAVEGLLFDFLNFYGSYNYLNGSRYQHTKEIRVFRRGIGAFSYRDSQGFRRYDSEQQRLSGHKGVKLNVWQTGVPVYHYSYVRPPDEMLKKSQIFAHYYMDETQHTKVFESRKTHDYYGIERVVPFSGTHPAVMAEWVKNGNYEFDPAKLTGKMTTKMKLAYLADKLTGRRIGEYRNYNLVKKRQ
ncbi:glycosyltransferase family 2 protein [Spirosoma luteum]|uniref:glycosyltransferase family 2 protein n=1 Tax=Spirosoma luteum TaxID=431553 RepID=UPI00035E8065|nr:glycosyltransferase family 2 protein [Spirosoma luteum]